jgi:hypothetical protein
LKKTYYFITIGILSLAMTFLAACNAALPAGAKASISADGKSAQVEFTGTVNSIGANQWVVSGQKLMISPHSIVNGTIVVGNTVKVSATVTSDGAVTADKIEPVSGSSTIFALADSLATIAPSETVNPSATTDPLVTVTPGPSITPGPTVTPSSTKEDVEDFSGVVEMISTVSWQVSGKVFIVNGQTVIKGNILVGDKVEVHFLNNGDGSFTAIKIELMNSQEQDSSEQEHSEDLKFTGKVEAFTPTSWTVNGRVFTIDSETEIKDNILLGDVVKVQYVVNSDGSFTASEIELAGENKAHNSQKKLTGVLQELTPTQATIDGVVVLITPQTQLDNGLVVGITVKAEVVTNSDGTITALKIKESSHEDGNGTGNSNKDDNGKSGSGHGSDGNHPNPPPGGDHEGDD